MADRLSVVPLLVDNTAHLLSLAERYSNLSLHFLTPSSPGCLLYKEPHPGKIKEERSRVGEPDSDSVPETRQRERLGELQPCCVDDTLPELILGLSPKTQLMTFS